MALAVESVELCKPDHVLLSRRNKGALRRKQSEVPVIRASSDIVWAKG